MVTDLLLERGDSILCESFTYFYLVDSVLPIKEYTAVPMDMDSHGICPEKLRQVILPLTWHLFIFIVIFTFWVFVIAACSVHVQAAEGGLLACRYYRRKL